VVIKSFTSVLNVKGQGFIVLGRRNIAVYITKFPKIDQKVKGTHCAKSAKNAQCIISIN
jgi:hypothetical protein